MARQRPCSVCGKMTSKFFLKDKKLDIAVCSGKCEHEYLETCDLEMEEDLLRHLDDKITRARANERICWIMAGVGLLILAVGFFAKEVNVLLFGALPMTVGAFSTRHFEHRIFLLTRTRKRIRI